MAREQGLEQSSRTLLIFPLASLATPNLPNHRPFKTAFNPVAPEHHWAQTGIQPLGNAGTNVEAGGRRGHN
jgi:hypothetical protein